jgi:hypothetical protein
MSIEIVVIGGGFQELDDDAIKSCKLGIAHLEKESKPIVTPRQ